MKTLLSSLSITLLTMASGCVSVSDRTSPEVAQELAVTPPMGWNSFDSYGVYLHEEAAMNNLEVMAKRLKPHGYEYFVIDNGWFGEYALMPGTHFPAEKHAHDITINEHGYYLASEVYFPNGIDRIIDRCHELGLKFGIHLMRGIPRKAYDLNLPIKGTNYTARDIANTEKKENCSWCTYNYAVDMSKPGAQEWYDGLVGYLADKGVDMIKYDDIVPHPDEVAAVARAIKKSGRPILLSLSPGGDVEQSEEAVASFTQGNMLRVTKDIWDEQKGINQCFAAWRKWSGYSRPGFWIDMDMIPLGQLQLMSPPPADTSIQQKSVRLAGHGYRRWSEFSKPQKITFMTLRALSTSPLMMGGDLPTLDDLSFDLITNKDMLACNQNGLMGTLHHEEGGVETWVTQKKGTSSVGWSGVFNRNDDPVTLTLSPQVVGFDSNGNSNLRDVWSKTDITIGQQITIPGHGAIFIARDE
jgi:hypothetical protein